MNDLNYEYVLKVAVEEAEDLGHPDRNDDSAWDKWHAEHFGRVLTVVDNSYHGPFVEAAEISEVCQEVENDIRHGDILGL